MRDTLVAVFNDGDVDNSRSLEQAINSLPGIKSLRNPPQVRNQEVGKEIVEMFKEMSSIPTLFFVDPWGYKGLTLKLINSVLQNWGCDCIIFFNYNRINMGLTNSAVESHMNALFGEERANTLRKNLEALSPEDREQAIVEELMNALKSLGGKFVLPFRFRRSDGNRTSHHLIFVSKAFKGYELMKSIMAKQSTLADQGVPSFEYNPADQRYPRLFEFTRPLQDLEGMLLKGYAGKTKTFRDIYVEHSVDRPYIDKNYKEVLLNLEKQGKIKTDPPAEKRRKLKGQLTFGDKVSVTFSERG